MGIRLIGDQKAWTTLAETLFTYPSLGTGKNAACSDPLAVDWIALDETLRSNFVDISPWNFEHTSPLTGKVSL
jgi:hypothetical protein